MDTRRMIHGNHFSPLTVKALLSKGLITKGPGINNWLLAGEIWNYSNEDWDKLINAYLNKQDS